MRDNHKLAWPAIVASLCTIYSFNNAVVEAAPVGALVQSLPGFNGSFPSKHHAGYIDMDNKHLFYYFVESERDPVTDPVVMWLYGGPGCSSLGGFVYEHGPFGFETDQKLRKLHLNQYSWSKVSNIIYLDSPVGAGFSYSDNTDDYDTSDLHVATDTHNFLIKWFQTYPEFLENSFYVAGESYAGVYVPTLASAIVGGNEAGRTTPVIKFKGYMIGNGVTDHAFDGNALVPFAHGMALISEDLFKETESACGGDYYDPKPESPCEDLVTEVEGMLYGLNQYNILEPCYFDSAGKKENDSTLPPSFTTLGQNSGKKRMGVEKRVFGRAWPQLTSNNQVPCFNTEVATTWLNNEDVRKAIHAKPASVSGPWVFCNVLLLNHDAGSMMPYHKNLTGKGYRGLIYSGDHDATVPYTGSEAWTKSLGYKIVDEWRSWNVDRQVAGYTQGYDKNLTFLTIKGAGHNVPIDKPKEALSFYSRWLSGQAI